MTSPEFMRKNKKNDDMEKIFYEIDTIFQLIDTEISKKGWKRGDLARALNKTEPWLSNIMNKKRKLTVQALLDIANVLGINPCSLLPGNNPTPKPDLEDFVWDIIKKRLDKYLDERENK